MIRRAVQHIGIKAYYPIKSRTYLRAIRNDGRPAMMIAYGWTSGFASEQEVLEAVGDVERWPNGRVWGVTHKVNKMHEGSGPQQNAERREYGTCPNDFMSLPASGVCDLCGYKA